MAQKGLTPVRSGVAHALSRRARRGSSIAERFSVDQSSELPVGAQLLWQLRSFIRTGQRSRASSCRACASWPSARGVNVNTVRSRLPPPRGGGAGRLAPGRRDLRRRRRAGLPRAARARRRGARRSARGRESRPRELARGHPRRLRPTPLPERPPRRRDQRGPPGSELRRQIARLEAELASYPRDLQPPPEPEVRPHHGAPDRQRRRARAHPRRAARPAWRAVAQADAKRERGSDGAARSASSEMVREPEANKWSWVSSEETGEPGCKEWRVTPRYGPVGAAMGWWRVKVSGGCPLAGGRREAGYEQSRRWSGRSPTGPSCPPSRSSSRSGT